MMFIEPNRLIKPVGSHFIVPEISYFVSWCFSDKLDEEVSKASVDASC